MPDRGPLTILIEGGVNAWNDWRRVRPEVEPRLDSAKLAGRDLRGAELSGAVLFEADLANANLSRARLRGAVLEGADLRKADLTEADLTDADLSGTWPGDPITRLAWPSGADLSGANLREAAFRHTNVTGTNLAGARLYRTVFADVDLSDAQGLEEVTHEGPSEISVSTFYRSRGRIPESFLRGAGVQRYLIDHLLHLRDTVEPIQYYSCFISHSSNDKEFAARLFSRMQEEQCRVWYAPEHMKPGKPLKEQIFDAIRRYDKLLLILSESSMNSRWVGTEIRRARQRESEEERRRQERPRILFPISLAPFGKVREWELFDADAGRDLAADVREYYIPDFSDWRNRASFEGSFGRLLSGLKVEG